MSRKDNNQPTPIVGNDEGLAKICWQDAKAGVVHSHPAKRLICHLKISWRRTIRGSEHLIIGPNKPTTKGLSIAEFLLFAILALSFVKRSSSMNAPKDENAIRQLMEQKLQLISQIHDLKAKIAKVNIDLQKAGATSSDLECW
jgi:hypothetical protein